MMFLKSLNLLSQPFLGLLSFVFPAGGPVGTELAQVNARFKFGFLCDCVDCDRGLNSVWFLTLESLPAEVGLGFVFGL